MGLTISGMLKKIKGGVTAARGFLAASVSCGIKESAGDKKDLCLIYSVEPHKTTSAAVFTTNRVKAAPVQVSTLHLRGGNVRAIIANSGNANACTGVAGIESAKAMAGQAAKSLGLRRRQVLVCSTGIIGLPLPEEKILPRISDLVSGLSSTGSDGAAKAIMTSDTKEKSAAFSFQVGMEKSATEVRVGAIGKGAGMICPNMATMLCFVTTDAKISETLLKDMVHEATDESFNRITVDGDMSTNDTVMVIANGASGAPALRKGSKDAKMFQTALTRVMHSIAKKIVKDGERVSKFVEIRVEGAASHRDARKVAEAVAGSTLVKCSWNGSDPNWGRVIHSVGYSGARIREELIDIYFDGKAACRNGLVSDTPITALESVTQKKSFTVTIDLNQGKSSYWVYTSDFSPEYVDFNRFEYAISKQKTSTAKK